VKMDSVEYVIKCVKCSSVHKTTPSLNECRLREVRRSFNVNFIIAKDSLSIIADFYFPVVPGGAWNLLSVKVNPSNSLSCGVAPNPACG